MAPEELDVIIGVDVCKDRLDLFEYHGERAYSISNDAAAIKTWLEGLLGQVKLALEPTNRYHLELAEAAHARGHEVYLIDPYRLSHYRAGLGRRAKTDAQDAQLLARFLEREIGRACLPTRPSTRSAIASAGKPSIMAPSPSTAPVPSPMPFANWPSAISRDLGQTPRSTVQIRAPYEKTQSQNGRSQNRGNSL